MIGELFNAMVEEVAGNNPANNRAGALPYLFAKCAAGAQIIAAPAAPAAAIASPAAPAYRL